MSRYADVASLIAETLVQRPDGSFGHEEGRTDVFVNVYSVGTSTWLAARSAGLHADAEIELRTLDYSGQERVEMRGVQYDVERSSERGEMTRLTLARRLANA